jgi:MYXO-CTERM domain-containing protein
MHASGPLGNLIVRVASDTTDRNVALNGEALAGALATNPASVEFGPLCLGGSAAMRAVMVYDPAPGDVRVTGVTQPANAVFSVLPASVGLGVAVLGKHAEEKTMIVSAKPTAAGELVDMFTLRTNIPSQPTLDIGLHLTGLAAGVAPSPSLVHFGALATGSTSSGKQVQLTNCGTGGIDVTDAHFEGADPTEFVIVLPTDLHATLQPTESITYTMIMTPKRDGTKSANLVIAYSGGMATVPLDGTGFGGDPTGNGSDRETYYGCSAGRGASWPAIGIALLALRRRRNSALR